MTERRLSSELTQLLNVSRAFGSPAAEGLELLKHFVKIEDPGLRQSIVDLVRNIAGQNDNR
jgi:hypothetical protein